MVEILGIIIGKQFKTHPTPIPTPGQFFGEENICQLGLGVGLGVGKLGIFEP